MLKNIVLGTAIGIALSTPALGGTVIIVSEVGGDVVMAGSGTIDTLLMDFFINTTTPFGISPPNWISIGSDPATDIYIDLLHMSPSRR